MGSAYEFPVCSFEDVFVWFDLLAVYNCAVALQDRVDVCLRSCEVLMCVRVCVFARDFDGVILLIVQYVRIFIAFCGVVPFRSIWKSQAVIRGAVCGCSLEECALYVCGEPVPFQQCINPEMCFAFVNSRSCDWDVPRANARSPLSDAVYNSEWCCSSTVRVSDPLGWVRGPVRLTDLPADTTLCLGGASSGLDSPVPSDSVYVVGGGILGWV